MRRSSTSLRPQSTDAHGMRSSRQAGPGATCARLLTASTGPRGWYALTCHKSGLCAATESPARGGQWPLGQVRPPARVAAAEVVRLQRSPAADAAPQAARLSAIPVPRRRRLRSRTQVAGIAPSRQDPGSRWWGAAADATYTAPPTAVAEDFPARLPGNPGSMHPCTLGLRSSAITLESSSCTMNAPRPAGVGSRTLGLMRARIAASAGPVPSAPRSCSIRILVQVVNPNASECSRR